MEDNSKTKIKKETMLDDKVVQKMMDTWDIVNCKYCGKEISMLNAKIIHNTFGEYFVCKEHAHE